MATLDFTPDKIAAIENVLADAWKNRALAQAVEEQDEREMSRAQRRMAARRKKRPDLIQPILIEEDGEAEEWFVTALSDADMNMIGIIMSRDGFTNENLTSPEAHRSYSSALLTVGLVISETDFTKYFEDADEAKEFYDDPRNAQTSVALRLQILALNPFIDIKKKAGKSKGMATVRLLPSASKR